jgi:hypothetical protein
MPKTFQRDVRCAFYLRLRVSLAMLIEAFLLDNETK